MQWSHLDILPVPKWLGALQLNWAVSLSQACGSEWWWAGWRGKKRKEKKRKEKKDGVSASCLEGA
jgi:hypothetical protein